MRSTIVYKEKGNYAGWPANHGSWQWGNEFLVGFMVGLFDAEGIGNGMHAILKPYFKLQARSLDGGETWTIEYPNRKFDGVTPSPAVPQFDLHNPDNIIRVCGNYDTGGEDCHPLGGFFLSLDKGHNWTGPYHFEGLYGGDHPFGGIRHNTSRTRVVGNRVFLSAARRDLWGSDWTFVARHNDHAFTFDAAKDVVWMDQYRAVMPAVATISDTTIVALRRKGFGKNWIDIVRQEEAGRPWQLMAQADETAGIANTGAYNGNPPALAAFGNRLVCAYANRSVKSMQLVWSDDMGKTWSDPVEFDRGQDPDIGYPQMFVRPDGLGVCVYYWSSKPGEEQHIKACIFDPRTLPKINLPLD